MDKLAEVLAEQFNCTIEYAKKHLPELLHDYCMYKGIENLVGVIVGVVFIITFIVIMVTLFRSEKTALKNKEDTMLLIYNSYDNETEVSGWGCLLVVAGIVIGFAGLLFLTFCIMPMIEALFFPDVYILEKVLDFQIGN